MRVCAVHLPAERANSPDQQLHLHQQKLGNVNEGNGKGERAAEGMGRGGGATAACLGDGLLCVGLISWLSLRGTHRQAVLALHA